MGTLKAIVNNNTSFEVIETETSGAFRIGKELVHTDWKKIDEQTFHLLANNRSYTIHVSSVDFNQNMFFLKINEVPFQVQLKDDFDLLLEKMGMSALDSSKVTEVNAPMPGLVLDVMAEVGQRVKKGDPLFVLEAMKMENIIKSPADGTIKSVNVKQKDVVEKNVVLLDFE